MLRRHLVRDLMKPWGEVLWCRVGDGRGVGDDFEPFERGRRGAVATVEGTDYPAVTFPVDSTSPALYEVQKSADLKTWTTLVATLPHTTTTYTDYTASTSTSRYYRIIER